MYISNGMSSIGTVKVFAQSPEVTALPKPRTNGPLSTYKTLLRTVKLTGLILLLGILQVSAKTSAQERISISLKAVPLERAFAEIEKRSGYTVFYNTEVLKTTRLVTVD